VRTGKVHDVVHTAVGRRGVSEQHGKHEAARALSRRQYEHELLAGRR
jgi:hypothetical protein